MYRSYFVPLPFRLLGLVLGCGGSSTYANNWRIVLNTLEKMGEKLPFFFATTLRGSKKLPI